MTGLAWTSAGGEILFIETSRTKGEGKVQITGQLGDVMKESVQIALTLVKAMFPEEAETLNESDIHIHVPAGAVPKDGPSAGITMATALYSAIFNVPVNGRIAMTGEITLRGEVLPIGGLKEKLLAAKMIGVKDILIPSKNESDYLELDEEITSGVNIHLVEDMRQVLDLALVR